MSSWPVQYEDDSNMQMIGNFLSFASRGDRVGLNQMLREGISPNVQDYDKRTALHLAASEGHASIVELLLAYKADVNLRDRWRRTPLTDARLYAHRDICRILEVYGGRETDDDDEMKVPNDEDSIEVNIEMSELNCEHSTVLRQGLFGESEKVKWRGTWVMKTVLQRHIDLPVKMVLSSNYNTLLRQLRHPNILQILGSVVHGGEMILITEYLPKVYIKLVSKKVDATPIDTHYNTTFVSKKQLPIWLAAIQVQGNLDDILARKGRLYPPTALRYALDIARNHDRNSPFWVHKDFALKAGSWGLCMGRRSRSIWIRIKLDVQAFVKVEKEYLLTCFMAAMSLSRDAAAYYIQIFSPCWCIVYFLEPEAVLLRGMNYLHQHKPFPIVHNNLHPRNLLLDEGGHLKIGEFWIPMLYQQIHSDQDSGEIIDCCRVINPPIDTKKDIRSFGLILYQMLEGRHNTTVDSESMHLKSIELEKKFHISRCPGRILQLIEDCTRKDSVEWPSFTAVIEVLEEVCLLMRKAGCPVC